MGAEKMEYARPATNGQTSAVIIERDLDCGRLYQVKRRELIELVRSLTDEQSRRIVPPTPEWSVHDVVAHLVGIAADLNALRFGSGDADAWTADQVRTRRAMSIGDLDQEWEREGPRFEEGLRLLGYEIGSHYLGDMLQHSADINYALGHAGIDEDEALVAGLDFYLESFHQTLMTERVGAALIQVPDEAWTLGSGQIVATLRAGRFEVFRCLGGRRSERQIRANDWTGDLDAVIGLISRYSLPQADIVEAG